jgi:ATP-dependent helicase HrpB
VEVRYLDRVDRTEVRGARGLPELASRVLRESWRESGGNALVFLPGIGEIRRAARLLESFAGSQDAILAPLHGSLGLDEQQAALTPSEKRKIILSTNIAETSLTVEGVDLVIDGGCARVLRNDPRHGIDRLEVERISKHSADQRAGRAGRLGPGKALRLWTRAEHSSLPEDEEPEIRRVDLASTVLELRAWGISDPAAFEWYEAPDPLRLERAEDLLVALGAVKAKHGPLTLRGKAMLEIPAHPRIARIIVEAHGKGLLEAGATLAALLEEKDIVPISAGPSAPERGRGKEAGPSDLLERCDLLSGVEGQGFRRARPGAGEVDVAAARAVARTRDVLIRDAREALGPQPLGKSKGAGTAGRGIPEETLLRILLCGYPDRVVRRRAKGSDRGVMTGGRGVVVSPQSSVRDAAFFLALDLDDGPHGQRGEARVHLASAVRREWIEEDLAQFIAERVETSFDLEGEKVRATRTLCYRDLPLEEPRDHKPPPMLAERLLAAAVRDKAEAIAGANLGAVSWLARVRSLAAWMPELELPRFDAAELGDILAGACAGKTSLAEVREADLLGLLKSSLPHSKLRAVEEHAPEALRVPSGNKIRLSYEPPRPPVLAVRLQEMFGLAETPTVAAGRVPVLLHLLGPNFRPVQITQDLRSFWNTTYAQVRKDLRARYPKHAWPEDPWTAQPTSRRRKK